MGGMTFNLRGRGVECRELGIEGLANDIQGKIDRSKLIQERSNGIRYIKNSERKITASTYCFLAKAMMVL